MLQMMKAIAEKKSEIKPKMIEKLNGCIELALSASSTHGLIAQLVQASEWNSVVDSSNPTQTNFL